jgi:putative endonuclease
MATKIGSLGEQIVSQWLQSKSYCILHHNWRCRWGEIDLIAEDSANSTLIFVEVKTRSSNNWDSDGLETISLAKQKKISNSAVLFLAKNPQYVDFYMRFDVALVNYKKQFVQQQLEISVAELDLVNRESIATLSNHFFTDLKNGYILRIVSYLENAFEVN